MDMMQEVLISDNLERDLMHAIDVCAPDKLFVLTDKTTNEHCWPTIEGFDCVKGAKLITIPPTDEHKNIANTFICVGNVGRTGRNTPLVPDKPWRRNGNRLGRICCGHL